MAIFDEKIEIFFLFGVVLARPFFPHFSPVDSKTVQRSALCRSRRELSNAYLLAKIGVDTAENEPLEVWGENSIQYSLHSLPKSAPPAAGFASGPPGRLYRARSRLYRSQILQVNTRWKALAEIYTMHSFAPFSNLFFFVKNRQKILRLN